MPIMVLLVTLAGQRAVMGEFAIPASLKLLGWAGAIAMMLAVTGMAVSVLLSL